MSGAFKVAGKALSPWLTGGVVRPPARPLTALDPLAPAQALKFVQAPVTQPIILAPPPVITPVIWRSDGPPLRAAKQAAPTLFKSTGFPLRTPTPAYNFRVVGVTKDSTGAVIGSCVVKLYRTSDDALLQTTTSDATTGAYEFRCASSALANYVVAYKAGSPDLAGTTVNTLLGT